MIKIDRVFVKEGLNWDSKITFERRKSILLKGDGEVLFEMDNIEVPSFWSQNATDILAQKYLRKAGVPVATEVVSIVDNIPAWLLPRKPVIDSPTGSETSIKQVIYRMVGCWTYWGWKGGYFDNEEEAKIFYNEIAYMIAYQMFAPNSPQWFNTGLNWAYGITGESQGHYYVEEEPLLGNPEVIKSNDAYTRPQPHACFIQKIEDHLIIKNGIMDTWIKEARLFKYGSGSGINFSDLRGKGEPLEGGGVSSGLLSWLKIGDVSAGGIKSGGTTRRAAKMVIVDIDHPDIEDFIEWKVKEEEKVAALITGSKINKKYLETLLTLYKVNSPGEEYLKVLSKAREAGVPEQYIQRVIQLAEQGVKEIDFEEFDNDWQGEAYKTVSGQNSNNSVSVPDEFMEVLEKNEDWELIWRTEKKNIEGGKRRDPKAIRTVSAKKLWDKICYSAWACADPGLFFYDNINAWNTCSNDGNIRGCNPCAEYIFLDDTACNLASLNLVKFYDSEKRYFKLDNYKHGCYLGTLVLDISMDMAQFPSPEIAMNSYKYRPLGLGYANLGGLFMRMGIPYDSAEALEWTGVLTGYLHFVAYEASSDMARDLNAFPRYEENKESVMRVIVKHAQAANRIGSNTVIDSLRMYIRKVVGKIEKNGVRNAFVTCIAPTGTIGLVMDCDTTGIEPDYALVKYKSLAGGGGIKIVNKGVEEGLIALGYTYQQAQDIGNYLLTHYTIEGAPHLLEEHYAVFDCANKCGKKGTRFIKYQAHLNILSAAQPFLSGSSSKTINMPRNVTIQEIGEVYKTAWKLGIKAIALYRDGSKLSQPLSSGNTLDDIAIDNKLVNTLYKEKFNQEFPVLKRERLPFRRGGYTQKAKISGHNLYIRTGEYKDGRLGEIFLDVHKEGTAYRSLLNCFAISISLGLQYGVPLDEFVDAFVYTRFEPAGPVKGNERVKMCTSILDYIFRDLAVHYLSRQDLAHNTVNLSKMEIEEREAYSEEVPLNGGRERGFTGDICPECQNLTMVRNGTCLKCITCGSTTGCS